MSNVHQNGALSPIWVLHTLSPMNNLELHTILFQLPFVSNSILLQLHTCIGRDWIPSRSGGTSCSCNLPGRLGSGGWYGRGGEIYLGDFIFWISSDDWRVSWFFRSLYVAAILWNTIQAKLVSLCVDKLLLKPDHFTNPEREFLFCFHAHPHFLFARLITSWKYLEDNFSWML